MSRKNHVRNLSFLMLALNLVPLAAVGEPHGASNRTPASDIKPAPEVRPAGPVVADPTQNSRLDDLTTQDAAATFRDFDLGIEGSEPNGRAVLYGRIFNDCVKYFNFSNTALQSSLAKSQGTQVGFEITDMYGKGRDCMAGHKADSCRNSTCSSLSTVSADGAAMILQRFNKTVSVGLIHQDPNKDGEGALQFENVNDKDLSHRSAKDIADARRAAALKAEADHINQLENDVKTCRKDIDQIGKARDAADELHDREKLSDDKYDAILKELDKTQLGVLTGRAKNDKLETLDDLLEEVRSFAADHPELANDVAEVYHQIAIRFQKDGSLAGNKKASEVLTQAQSLEGLNEASIGRLNDYQTDLSIYRAEKVADGGSQYNPALGSTIYSLMSDLQNRAQTVCSAYMNNQTVESYTSCANAQQLPQQVYADVQNHVSQGNQKLMQKYQLMSQFGGGQAGAGVPGGQMQSGGFNAMSMNGAYGLSPFAPTN